jgi:hypothetical protein
MDACRSPITSISVIPSSKTTNPNTPHAVQIEPRAVHDHYRVACAPSDGFRKRRGHDARGRGVFDN